MRWVRRLGAAILAVVLLVGVPLVLAVVIGLPWPARWPDEQQLRAWVAQPLTEQTVAAALIALVWLLWLGVAATIVIDGIVRVRRRVRRLARLPLPTPLQATATGVAGVAVFGTGTTPTVVDQPAASPGAAATDLTADTAPFPTGGEREVTASAEGAVTLPDGGWLPADVADAVAAVTAWGWRRRRRDYRPRAFSAGDRDDADLIAPFPTITAVLSARDARIAASAEPGAHEVKPVAGGGAAPLRADRLPAGGVGLTGAGATDAARGLLVTALLAGPSGQRMRVVTTAVDLALLFGEAVTGLGAVPGLYIGESLDAAALAYRANTRSAPATGLPQVPVMVLTHAPGDQSAQQRLAATVSALPGPVTLAVIGAWSAGTWEVAEDGTSRPVGEPANGGPRLCVLTARAAADLLALAGDATSRPVLPANEPPAGAPGELLPSAAGVPAPRVAVEGGRLPEPQLRLQVLGDLVATRSGVPVQIRRDAGRQLVVYLAVHPAGASGRDLTALLWPGPHSAALTQRLYTTISDLRGALRTDSAPVVQRVGDRYRLHPDLTVDLWDLHQAIGQAAHAITGPDREQALRRIIVCYRGDLAAEYTWSWLPPVREALRRHAIDAYTTLAAMAADADTALELLHDALSVDPLNEALHLHTIRTLAAAGQNTAAVDLLHRYTTRLADAGLPTTDRLDTLTADLTSSRVAAR